MKTSEKTDKIFQKLFEVKQELGSVTKKSDNPFFKSRYADLNQHLDTIEPVLASKGLFLLQPPTVESSGQTVVETTVIEPISGQFVSASMSLALSKQDMQQMGAAITYARRFILNSLFGMKSEDDDGETAVGRGNASKASNTTSSTTSAPNTTKRSSFRKKKEESTSTVAPISNGALASEASEENGWS